MGNSYSVYNLMILLIFKSEKQLTFANRTANNFLYFKSISRLLMNNWWYTLLAPFTKGADVREGYIKQTKNYIPQVLYGQLYFKSQEQNYMCSLL